MSSTSDLAYVWAWLPGQTEPVAVGLLRRGPDGRLSFAYGRRYLASPGAVALYGLPFTDGYTAPPDGWVVAPSIRDAAPDAWGRRVLMDRLMHRRGRNVDTDDLDEMTYLLESASNRVGALDFQRSAEQYVPRGDSHADLAKVYDAATALEAGRDLSPDLRAALDSGTGIGGARPKAYLRYEGRESIVKLAVSDDPFPVVKAEGAAVELARRAGIDVPAARVIRVSGRYALAADRFDRTGTGARRMVVTALTFTGLREAEARYVTYGDIREALAREGTGDAIGPMLFERIAFNMLISNTDDHARNHAAFWDGEHLSLTPAYDLSPSSRSGETAHVALAYSAAGDREANVARLVSVAHQYHLDRPRAEDIVGHLVTTIEEDWHDAADLAELTAAERDFLWRRQFLNPGALYGFKGH